jgi:hypothetical protein
MLGRVEHVTSGQVAHVTSLRGLVAFMAQVLRQRAGGDHGSAYATLMQQPSHGDGAASAADAGDADGVRSAPEPTRRGRKKGSES